LKSTISHDKFGENTTNACNNSRGNFVGFEYCEDDGNDNQDKTENDYQNA